MFAAYSARGRSADAEIALANDDRDEWRARAERAEADTMVLAAAARDYLARVPTGDGPVDRDRLRVLLDSTAHAVGASTPGPAPSGGDGNRARVG